MLSDGWLVGAEVGEEGGRDAGEPVADPGRGAVRQRLPGQAGTLGLQHCPAAQRVAQRQTDPVQVGQRLNCLIFVQYLLHTSIPVTAATMWAGPAVSRSTCTALPVSPVHSG